MSQLEGVQHNLFGYFWLFASQASGKSQPTLLCLNISIMSGPMTRTTCWPRLVCCGESRRFCGSPPGGFYLPGCRAHRGWGWMYTYTLVYLVSLMSQCYFNLAYQLGCLRWIWISCPTHMRHVAILGDSRDFVWIHMWFSMVTADCTCLHVEWFQVSLWYNVEIFWEQDSAYWQPCRLC